MIKMALSKFIVKRGSKKTLKISNITWSYIGVKTGWLKESHPCVFTSRRICSADISGVTDQQIHSAVRKAIYLPNNPNFHLVTLARTALPIDECKDVLADAFMDVMSRSDSASLKDLVSRYVSSGRDMNIGVALGIESGRDKLMLIPIFNQNALTQFKIPFTRHIQSRNFMIIDANKEEKRKERPVTLNTLPVSLLEDKSKTDIIYVLQEVLDMANAAGILSSEGKVRVESTGHRLTNWDTGYTFEISGHDKNYLKDILEMFTQITNEDKQNIQPTGERYALTKKEEVSKLMGNLGLGQIFDKAVNTIKELEEQKDLKERVNNISIMRKNLRKLDDAQTIAQWKKIKNDDAVFAQHVADLRRDVRQIVIELSNFKDSVFTHIFNAVVGKFGNKIMSSGIKIEDFRDAMATAFAHDSPMSQSDTGDLITLLM